MYITTGNPADPRDALLASVSSYAHQEPLGDVVGLHWRFFAQVPEPSTALLLSALLVLGHRSVFGAGQQQRSRAEAICNHRCLLMPFLFAGLSLVAVVARAQVLVGSQVRVDAGSGHFTANETSIAAVPDPSNSSTIDVVAAWNDYRLGESRVAFAITLDGGRTWRRELLDLPDGCTNSNDPFTFFDNLTGRMWVGAAVSACPGRRIVLAPKQPRRRPPAAPAPPFAAFRPIPD